MFVVSATKFCAVIFKYKIHIWSLVCQSLYWLPGISSEDPNRIVIISGKLLRNKVVLCVAFIFSVREHIHRHESPTESKRTMDIAWEYLSNVYDYISFDIKKKNPLISRTIRVRETRMPPAATQSNCGKLNSNILTPPIPRGMCCWWFVSNP